MHAKLMLEDLEKLRDFNINVRKNEELAANYQSWIDQFNTNKITCDRFIIWLKIQYDYYKPKDKLYANYINSLVKK